MPNYVYNKLDVIGERSDLEAFIERNRSDTPDGYALDFERLVPMPAEVFDADPDATRGGIPSWYAWRVDHWGRYIRDPEDVVSNAMHRPPSV